MHYLTRVAGYLRLSEKGLAFAASLALGYNQQLQNGSQTYPDRFFFMGGTDSLRGFLQASLVPEDIAQDILEENSTLTINEVTIRGGDFTINPRAELRIPITSTWQTALFVDAGNLWLDARQVDPTVLRYAAGSGLRATTPIGPLALDYGINLDRRPWEDFGAFHFSIGLF
jgi:outer membrane protein assembly factor BamA